MTQVLKTLCLIHFELIPFSHFQPLLLPLSGEIRNGRPLYKDQGDGQFCDQNQLDRLQMVQLECPKYRNPCDSSIFG